MKALFYEPTFIGKAGGAIGKGIIAGIAGTIAITISQMIEMKITGRAPSTAPADAASKVLDVKETSEDKKQKFSQQVHWSYGISWGIARGLLSLCGLKGLWATAAHFSAVTTTAFFVETKLEIAPPVDEWKISTIGTTLLHHAVYAIAAGFVYEVIDKNKFRLSRLL